MHKPIEKMVSGWMQDSTRRSLESRTAQSPIQALDPRPPRAVIYNQGLDGLLGTLR